MYVHVCACMCMHACVANVKGGEAAQMEAALSLASILSFPPLQGCTSLHKVLLHCPHLSQLAITNCPALDTVMLWSDELTTLDLSGCTSIITLKLQCPALIE